MEHALSVRIFPKTFCFNISISSQNVIKRREQIHYQVLKDKVHMPFLPVDIRVSSPGPQRSNSSQCCRIYTQATDISIYLGGIPNCFKKQLEMQSQWRIFILGKILIGNAVPSQIKLLFCSIFQSMVHQSSNCLSAMRTWAILWAIFKAKYKIL